MEFVPYMSWGADLTDDYHERTVLRSYAYVFNQVGMLIGMVLPTIIVDWAMNLGRTSQQSWQLVGMFTGVAAGAAILLSALKLRKGDRPKDDPEIRRLKEQKKNAPRESIFRKGVSILKEFFSLLKLKAMRYILFGNGLTILVFR